MYNTPEKKFDYDSAKKKSRIRGIGLSGFLILLLLLAAYFIIRPALAPNALRGDLIDFVITPQKDGTNRLWILTDGSFNYVSSTKTPGSYSVGRKCLSCKTWLYDYDPLREKIMMKKKITHNDTIINSCIARSGNKLYYIANAYHDDEPKILIWDAHTGNAIMDTRGFIALHPELRSGLITAVYDREKQLISLSTKDGRNYLAYSLEKERLYPSEGVFMNEREKDQRKATIFALTPERSNDSRRLLYRITASRGLLIRHRGHWNESEMEYLKHRSNDTSYRQLSDKVFLDGILYHHDTDCAIIIHLNQMGKKADRILTCMDADGKIKWTVPPSELFDEMKIDEAASSFSGMTFTKDKIAVSRSGNLVVLKLEGVGLIGFDFRTGKKVFTIDI